MPLIKGKSEKAFKKNIKTEYEEGKPLKQSLAIAYAMKRKAQHKAKGGMMQGGGHDRSHYDQGGKISAQESMRKAFGTKPSPVPDKPDAEVAAQKKVYGYSDGGQIKDNYQPSGKPHVDKEFSHEPAEVASGYESHEGNDVKPNGPAVHEAEKKLNQHAVDMMASTSMSEQDIVDRIMKKRSENFSGLDRYSEGGKIANDTGEGQEADCLPNQFDDLVLRDDLESSYGDDDNSGDNLGNAQEDEDRKDIVARIMSSRKKKDRMPNPA